MNSINWQYDSLVKSHQLEMKGAIAYLHRQLLEKDCRFGEHAIPCFMKPYFLPMETAGEMRGILRNILSMLEKVIRAYFEHKELRPLFGLSRDAESFVQIDPGYRHNVVIARPDAYINRGKISFLEFNCDSPAGAGYCDIQEEIFKQTFGMKWLTRNYRWEEPKRMRFLLNALLGCYAESGRKKKFPHIAIMDWKELKTLGEFRIIKKNFEACGYPTVIADPRELKFRRGKLYAGTFPIDLVYRRAIFRELMQRKRQVKPFLDAYHRDRVCVANPFRSRLAAHKSVLAIMTDPRFKGLFGRNELSVICDNIPWTRIVSRDPSRAGNVSRDGLKRVMRKKADYVLKPADSYGGQNVKIGRETSLKDWQSTLRKALRPREHWVVQRFVPIPKMKVPLIRGHRLVLREKKMNINPFAFRGRFAGAIVRLSEQSVINVSAGGGLIPAMTYKPVTAKG